MSERYDNCFVCGAANPIGLRLEFSFTGDGASQAELILPDHFEGYPNVIHGGIVSTLLDEVMAKAVLHSGKVAFTARLQVSFRRPVPANTTLHLEGRIVSSKTRTIITAARLYDTSGDYAEAEGVFIVPKS